MEILYEDNHLLIVNKDSGQIVQGDKTGDEPLVEILKKYIKKKYNKPGNVFLGVTHRLDRPVSGVLVFARTSKALERMNKLFAEHSQIKKTYLALVQGCPEQIEGQLHHYLVRVEKENKSYAYSRPKPNAKEALLNYRVLRRGNNYSLVEVVLLTGRHHQIRCQLSSIGCPIKGDLKYGAKRSNVGGGISLHAYSISFIHPVSGEQINVVAQPPKDNIWDAFMND